MVLVVGLLAKAWPDLGAASTGARRARLEQSAQWRDGKFVNAQPRRDDGWGMLKGAFSASPDRSPREPVSTREVQRPLLEAAPPTGLRVTWFGHSSALVELDGHRVLTDPIWSERASPLPWLGPRRYFPPLIPLEALPEIDAVVISHDHYDHLDRGTVSRMKGWATTFVVPLGLGAHLASWGIPETRIVELDWWERASINGLAIVATPSRHASGRALYDNDSKLWSGFALLGPRHRVYYSGDTSLFPAMGAIGERLGPFDLTLIEVGQYDRSWPDWHLGPEQALQVHGLVRGKVLLPVHWGLFTLGYHSWTEPIERALAAAHRAGATVICPRPGQSVEPERGLPLERWWPELPWKTARVSPVVSTQLDPPTGAPSKAPR